MSYMSVGDELTVDELAALLRKGEIVGACGFNATHKTLVRVETADGRFIELIAETYREVAADDLTRRDGELAALCDRLAEPVEYRLRGGQYQDMWATFDGRNEIAASREP